MVRTGNLKMTLLLWIGLAAFFNDKVSDLSVGSAHAGWEYNESARPGNRKSAGSNDSPATESDENADAPPARVQVFGRPVFGKSPRAAEDPVDPEFNALRSRLRTKQVAENTGDTESDFEPSVDPKPVPKSSRARAATRPAPAYIPPAPPMETEVITPQRATGKKVKKGKVAAMSAVEPTTGADEVNAAFPYTHILPSPFNLPRGGFTFGTSFAYGIFDFLEVSTNAARLIQKQINFEAKVPLIEYPTFVASAFIDYNSFNGKQYDASNPDLWMNRWQPGVVTGYEITPDVAFFLGGNFNFGKDPNPIVTTSGYLHGAQVNMEWSWLYNPSTSRLGNNAIAIGMKYDFTYSLFGFGFTHHWKNFELGVHYTFADRNRFLPIFGFTTSL